MAFRVIAISHRMNIRAEVVEVNSRGLLRLQDYIGWYAPGAFTFELQKA